MMLLFLPMIMMIIIIITMRKKEGITFTIKQVGVNYRKLVNTYGYETDPKPPSSYRIFSIKVLSLALSCPFKFPVACTNLCDLAVTKMEPWWNHGWLGVPNQNRKSGRQFSIPTSRVRKIIMAECCLRIRYNQGWMNLSGCKLLTMFIHKCLPGQYDGIPTRIDQANPYLPPMRGPPRMYQYVSWYAPFRK